MHLEQPLPLNMTLIKYQDSNVNNGGGATFFSVLSIFMLSTVLSLHILIMKTTLYSSGKNDIDL